MDNIPIGKVIKYKPLIKYIGLQGKYPILNKDVVLGVEIELEHIKYISDLSGNTIHLMQEDSLKIDGQEFVTIPLQLKYIEIELKRLFSGVQGKETQRCSTHVHMNIRDMSVNQLKTMILLYMIFERSLYRFSGDRWNNRFCIPLQHHIKTISTLFRYLQAYTICTGYNLQKYAGINLLPIWGKTGNSKKQGTIEFRQMKGTTDISYILDWCSLITSLKRYAQRTELQELITRIKEINTTSSYLWLALDVFKDKTSLITEQPTFVEDIKTGISYCKYVLTD